MRSTPLFVPPSDGLHRVLADDSVYRYSVSAAVPAPSGREQRTIILDEFVFCLTKAAEELAPNATLSTQVFTGALDSRSGHT